MLNSASDSSALVRLPSPSLQTGPSWGDMVGIKNQCETSPFIFLRFRRFFAVGRHVAGGGGVGGTPAKATASGA